MWGGVCMCVPVCKIHYIISGRKHFQKSDRHNPQHGLSEMGIKSSEHDAL